MAASGLHVALITGTFGRGKGTGGQAWHLATGLAARGHRVQVFARFIDATDGFAGEVHAIPRSRRALWGVVEQVRSVAPFDLVHALERAPGADIVRTGGGVHRAWLDGAPLSLKRAGRWSLRHRRELALDRASVQGARRVITNSQRVAAEVVAFHGVATERVRVVRNGVDQSALLGALRPRGQARRALGIDPSSRVALFLGHDARRKGLEVAQRAFRRVARPGDVLLAAGPRHGPEGVRCLGPCAPEEVLGAADALLLPSRYDASSNAVLEALAAGLPTVCSGRDGASEVVPDRRLVVTSPYDVDGFARALGYAWRTDAAARWQRAARSWPVSRMVDDTEATYRELVDG
mgnify:CR=1 FL=1